MCYEYELRHTHTHTAKKMLFLRKEPSWKPKGLPEVH